MFAITRKIVYKWADGVRKRSATGWSFICRERLPPAWRGNGATRRDGDDGMDGICPGDGARFTATEDFESKIDYREPMRTKEQSRPPAFVKLAFRVRAVGYRRRTNCFFSTRLIEERNAFAFHLSPVVYRPRRRGRLRREGVWIVIASFERIDMFRVWKIST